MARRERFQSDFVKREREGKQHFVRLYSPQRGQQFRFRSEPGTVWIRCPVSGAIMRLATYRRRRRVSA